jgi:hypothetical protein
MPWGNLSKALVQNPLAVSLYTDQNTTGNVAPGEPRLFITETTDLYLTTEDGIDLTTET